MGADPRDRRATTTPLGMALRGSFLAGSKPVDEDIVRRFIACAADKGIGVFRLHDPLNDVSNLKEAGEAIVGAGKEFHVGPRLQRRPRRARSTRSSSGRSRFPRSARRA